MKQIICVFGLFSVICLSSCQKDSVVSALQKAPVTQKADTLLNVVPSSIKSDTTTIHSNAFTQINASDSGKTVAIKQGQIIKITLGNPADGGYDFDEPKYDPSVMTLVDHIRNFPPPNSAIGDSGSDTWVFSAAKTGTTGLTITATRPWEKNSPIVIFTGAVAVQ